VIHDRDEVETGLLGRLGEFDDPAEQVRVRHALKK